MIKYRLIQVFSRIAFLVIALGILGCKSERQNEKKLSTESLNGKYISQIVQDRIDFEDGSSFDMGTLEPIKVFYLVRHAEKDSVPKEDPVLSTAGALRADRLAAILKGTRVDAIYSTFFTRTIFTAGGVSQNKGMQVKPYNKENMKDMVSKVVTDPNENRVLVVGHSNTTPVLANFLIGTDFFKSSFDESDYDNFVIVIQTNKQSTEVLALKFK